MSKLEVKYAYDYEQDCCYDLAWILIWLSVTQNAQQSFDYKLQALLRINIARTLKGLLN